jgi:hypothetical protein
MGHPVTNSHSTNENATEHKHLEREQQELKAVQQLAIFRDTPQIQKTRASFITSSISSLARL